MKHVIFGCFLLFATNTQAETKPAEKISIQIEMICPPSEQLEKFRQSIPDPQVYNVDYKDFEKSFIENMTQLIQLVESGQVNNSHWSVKIESE